MLGRAAERRWSGGTSAAPAERWADWPCEGGAAAAFSTQGSPHAHPPKPPTTTTITTTVATAAFTTHLNSAVCLCPSTWSSTQPMG